MRNSLYVHLLNGILDESTLRGGSITLRGVLDPSTFSNIKRDVYQRERFSLKELRPILEGLRANQPLPDIELGMRGQNFIDKDGVYTLKDPVFVIDGLQRMTAAAHFLTENPTANVRLGALIHFDTTLEWEKERFRILNSDRRKVSPNVLLRNTKEDSVAIAQLWGLSTNDKAFALHDRVTWSQNAARGDLITALTLAKICGFLHSHKAATKSNGWYNMSRQLDKVATIFGTQVMRDNVKAFFDLVDECWGVKTILYRTTATHMKGTFLEVLSRVIADHHDFWRQPDEKRLFIEPALRKKIAQFPLNDPAVTSLASSSGKSRFMLYFMLRDHINSGKRTKRLASRRPDGEISMEDDADDQEIAA